MMINVVPGVRAGRHSALRSRIRRIRRIRCMPDP